MYILFHVYNCYMYTYGFITHFIFHVIFYFIYYALYIIICCYILYTLHVTTNDTYIYIYICIYIYIYIHLFITQPCLYTHCEFQHVSPLPLATFFEHQTTWAGSWAFSNLSASIGRDCCQGPASRLLSFSCPPFSPFSSH